MDAAIGQILTAGADLAGLVTSLSAERADRPGDDLVSALASANVDGEQLTPAELASFFILLVVAGNETTRTALSHALVLLTDHEDQRELLLADLEGRMGSTVEEIVRYVPGDRMRRSITRDAVVNGHQFREGDKCALMYWSANRDESVFGEPVSGSTSLARLTRTSGWRRGPPSRLGAHWLA
jgi:cytochrome P450